MPKSSSLYNGDFDLRMLMKQRCSPTGTVTGRGASTKTGLETRFSCFLLLVSNLIKWNLTCFWPIIHMLAFQMLALLGEAKGVCFTEASTFFLSYSYSWCQSKVSKIGLDMKLDKVLFKCLLVSWLRVCSLHTIKYAKLLNNTNKESDEFNFDAFYTVIQSNILFIWSFK